MKAFEEWWDKREGSQFNDILECEIAWKAALGWIQLRLEFGGKVAYSNDDILMAIKKEIREELEK